MEDKPIKAVVFDIDGTLSPHISWTRITEELGASVQNHDKLFADFKENKLTLDEGQDALLKLWRGNEGVLSKQKLLEILDRWVLKEDTLDLFAHLKGKGYITCLITGSVDLFGEVIAKRVGADFWYANSQLVWDENENLKKTLFVSNERSDYEFNAGKMKLQQFLEFCISNYLEPGDCAVVGDDINDIALFEITKRGIAVESATSSALDSVAWKKVSRLAEIKNIL